MTTQSPAFVAYTVSTSVLVLNQLILWLMSAGARGKSKTALNPEDVTSIAKGGTVSATDPPEVARIMRVHANGQANILQFLIMGALFVQVGGSALEAQILFGVFTAARVLFSVAYMTGKQPYRTMMFVLGAITTFVLIVEVLRHLFM